MSAIDDTLVAEIKRLEGVVDEWEKVARHNAGEFKKQQELCQIYEKEKKELQERLDKVISINIELKQFKENYLERKRKRKERKDNFLQNPPCPVKKRKKSFPEVPP